jgi:hypothetical protein
MTGWDLTGAGQQTACRGWWRVKTGQIGGQGNFFLANPTLAPAAHYILKVADLAAPSVREVTSSMW